MTSQLRKRSILVTIFGYLKWLCNYYNRRKIAILFLFCRLKITGGFLQVRFDVLVKSYHFYSCRSLLMIKKNRKQSCSGPVNNQWRWTPSVDSLPFDVSFTLQDIYRFLLSRLDWHHPFDKVNSIFWLINLHPFETLHYLHLNTYFRLRTRNQTGAEVNGITKVSNLCYLAGRIFCSSNWFSAGPWEPLMRKMTD